MCHVGRVSSCLACCIDGRHVHRICSCESMQSDCQSKALVLHLAQVVATGSEYLLMCFQSLGPRMRICWSSRSLLGPLFYFLFSVFHWTAWTRVDNYSFVPKKRRGASMENSVLNIIFTIISWIYCTAGVTYWKLILMLLQAFFSANFQLQDFFSFEWNYFCYWEDPCCFRNTVNNYYVQPNPFF